MRIVLAEASKITLPASVEPLAGFVIWKPVSGNVVFRIGV